MIHNIPTADELRTVSLRLYFKAWSEITDILVEWDEYSELLTPPFSADRGHFYLDPPDAPGSEETIEWQQYIEAAQSDLQGIYTLIQQSQEIGLKSRICEVSPYLLLKRTDIRPADSSSNTWDFTDFPTLDASELVRVHNMFCSLVLSQQFQLQYDEMRRSRNKISHLGIYRRSIDPHVIIGILQTHYQELYPGRNWMHDRLHFATLHRWADYADHHFNERTGLFNELSHLLPGLSDSQFAWLMKHDRKETRYICHSCVADANFEYGSEVPTAYRIDDASVHCVICDSVYPMRAGRCARDDCASELLSADPDSDGQCMHCGWSQDDWKRHQKQKAELRDQLGSGSFASRSED